MTHLTPDRRQFLRDLGMGAATVPFLSGLSSLWAADEKHTTSRKRLIRVVTSALSG